MYEVLRKRSMDCMPEKKKKKKETRKKQTEIKRTKLGKVIAM